VRFEFVRTRFSRLGEVLDARSISAISGLLMDLGVSSPQLDDAARGFSLRLDGPLDMRMDPDCGQSVAQWLARATWPKCGESCASSAMSGLLRRLPKRSWLASPPAGPWNAPSELAEVVARAIPAKDRKDPNQHPATRTFQAYGFSSIRSLKNWR